MRPSSPWRVTLPGRPPSWNDSYRIVRQSRTTANGPHYYHTMAKTQKLIDWQADMKMIVQAAKPSGWKPQDRFIGIRWEVRLERHIDMDNLQKAVNDVLEMATGVNDKWFYPIFTKPTIGVPRREAGIDLTIDLFAPELIHDVYLHDGDGCRLTEA